MSVAEALDTYTTKLAWQMHALPTQPTECSTRKCSLDKTCKKAARRRGVVCNYLSVQLSGDVQMQKHTALTYVPSVFFFQQLLLTTLNYAGITSI